MLDDTDLYQTYACPQSNSITTLYQIDILKLHLNSKDLHFTLVTFFSKGGGNIVLIVTKQTPLFLPILLSINFNSLSYNIRKNEKNSLVNFFSRAENVSFIVKKLLYETIKLLKSSPITVSIKNKLSF